MPLVFAKSKMDKRHVEVKKNIGCDGIEYQMLAGDYNGRQELVNPALCVSVVEEHPAHAIHLPMNNCNIEDDIEACLEYTAQLAEHSHLVWASKGKTVEPIVVLHNETHFQMLDLRRRDEIVAMMAMLLEAYPHVQYVIENTTPFRWLQHQSTQLSSGYFDSPVVFADYLRGVLSTERIGTCLDTCHAKISIDLMNAVCDRCEAIDMKFTMDRFFELYKPTCKLFHFASCDDGGYGAGHATPYTDEKLGELQDEVRLYIDNKYDCPITLEINEKDLLISDRYEASKRNLQRAWIRETR